MHGTICIEPHLKISRGGSNCTVVSSRLWKSPIFRDGYSSRIWRLFYRDDRGWSRLCKSSSEPACLTGHCRGTSIRSCLYLLPPKNRERFRPTKSGACTVPRSPCVSRVHRWRKTWPVYVKLRVLRGSLGQLGHYSPVRVPSTSQDKKIRWTGVKLRAICSCVWRPRNSGLNYSQKNIRG